MRYFKFEELLVTETQHRNIPNWEEVRNLTTLASFLDQVRLEFGKPIRVNSAFRSKAVNEAVGGSSTSAHTRGLAADIRAYSGKESDNRALLKILEGRLSKIDQLISYHRTASNKDTDIRFIHVGLCEGVPRMQRLYK